MSNNNWLKYMQQIENLSRFYISTRVLCWRFSIPLFNKTQKYLNKCFKFIHDWYRTVCVYVFCMWICSLNIWIFAIFTFHTCQAASMVLSFPCYIYFSHFQCTSLYNLLPLALNHPFSWNHCPVFSTPVFFSSVYTRHTPSNSTFHHYPSTESLIVNGSMRSFLNIQRICRYSFSISQIFKRLIIQNINPNTTFLLLYTLNTWLESQKTHI